MTFKEGLVKNKVVHFEDNNLYEVLEFEEPRIAETKTYEKCDQNQIKKTELTVINFYESQRVLRTMEKINRR